MGLTCHPRFSIAMNSDKVVIVTGAGSGIGKTVTQHLLNNGCRVVLAGRRESRLTETVQEWISESDGMVDRDACVLCQPTDVTSPESVAELFSNTVAKFGRVDVVFNNAGATFRSVPLEDLPLEEWQSLIDVNLTGSFLCIREAFRIMKNQQPMGGRIINNGSVSAQVPRPDSIAYTASKHAVSGLTKSTALDGRKYNIACSQIDIGNAATQMTKGMSRGVRQADGSLAPEPTMDPIHIADAVLNLVRMPPEVNIPQMTIMATKMPFIGRG